MNQSENIKDLAAALCKAQAEMTFASKDSTNPHFKSKYADLSAVWDAIREPLTNHGLSVTQLIDILNDKPVLVSILMHVSGQWIKSTIPIINSNNSSQGQGSGITYCRRYSLAALVGCVQDDDDGEATMDRDSKTNGKSKNKIDEPKANEAPITDKQRAELNAVADNCDPEYIAKIYDWLKTKGVNGFDGIKTESLFKSVIMGMKKNAEFYQGK